MSSIVVGVDGSETSRNALDWAIGEAKLRNCELIVAHSWQIPVVVGPEMVYVPPPDRELLLADVRAAAEELISDSGLAASGVQYRLELPEGRAGAELVELAEGADLLVVGSRGAGSVRDFLLGSTSNYCVHHATCPIVVVRTQPAD